MKQLSRDDWFTVISMLAWRLIQAMVIVPGAIVASVLALSIVGGQEPVRLTVESIFEYAEDHVRPAPQGHVLSTSCIDPEKMPDEPQPIQCDETSAVEVPIGQVVDDTLETLLTFYYVLVVIALGLVIFMYRGRRFLGLSRDTASK